MKKPKGRMLSTGMSVPSGAGGSQIMEEFQVEDTAGGVDAKTENIREVDTFDASLDCSGMRWSRKKRYYSWVTQFWIPSQRRHVIPRPQTET